MEIYPICINCKHYKKKSSCEAFNDIPSKIWSEGSSHDKPTSEQKNNIIYTPLQNGQAE
jgi:hypothetical protein